MRETHNQAAKGKSPKKVTKTRTPEEQLRLPLPFEVVIMAGGRGERLRPLTLDIPKPLLDVGGKPIVEWSIQRLAKCGVKYFTFCINHLGDKIVNRFGDGAERGVHIEYISEREPLGTIGGISLKENFRFQDILVINGDLLTTINFEKFYSYFLDNDADLAVAAIPYRVSLPYGTFQLNEKQELLSVNEKPTFTYHLNTGIYLMRRELLDLIPREERFDAIDLIDAAIQHQAKVVSYPLLEYWIDIGQMEDYQKAQKDIRFLEL